MTFPHPFVSATTRIAPYQILFQRLATSGQLTQELQPLFLD